MIRQFAFAVAGFACTALLIAMSAPPVV